MSTDPNDVRVDLIKVKRKLYISYPSGSKEQKDFLVASKLSEIGYLSKLVPSDLVDIVFEEYNKLVYSEMGYIGLGIGVGVLLSILLYKLTNGFPFVWLAPLLGGLSVASFHGQHLYDEYKRMKPFQSELRMLQQKIKRLRAELKDLK
jgi:hypothetical protein